MDIERVRTFQQPQELIDEFNKIKDSGRVVLIFTGGNDLATGKNWCPDCIAAKPLIEKCVEMIVKEEAAIVLIGIVLPRESWVGRSDHPFKKDAVFKARGVPTMLLWQDGQILLRIDDQKDFENPDLMAQFFDTE